MESSAAAPGPSDVAVVSDSSACLPEPLLAEYEITTVALAYLIDGELFHDGQIEPAELRKRIETATRVPTTTAPAPGEFLDTFRQLHAQGKRSVLCLTLPSVFSGTHSSAVNAADMAAKEIPDLRVVVLDTGGLAMAHGFAVLAAARAAKGGGSLDDCVAAVQEVGRSAQLIGALDTTHYLAKSGRVPWIVHWAASVLQIKPVLVATEGHVRSFGRPRTMRNALDRLLRYLEKRGGPPERLHVSVAHWDAPERAAELAERVREAVSPAELITTEFTPVMSIHSGPGFVGLAFYSDEPQPEVDTAAATRSRRLERDARVLEEALGELPAPIESPTFVMLAGLPGAGKTHLASAITSREAFAVIESDRLRKVLVKQPNYSQRESGRVFAAIHELLDRLLARGVPCLLDATNLREAHRRPVYEIAEKRGARTVVVWVEAPDGVARARLEERSAGGDPQARSDAGVDVYEMMSEEVDSIPREHLVVDTTGDVDAEAARVLRALGVEVGSKK